MSGTELGETGQVMIEWQLGDDPTHRVARRRFTEKVSPRARNVVAKKLFERIRWLIGGGNEGRSHMTDKGYRTFSVFRATIEMTLEAAAEEGESPLHVLENALLGYEGTHGGEDIREARMAIKRILDAAAPKAEG